LLGFFQPVPVSAGRMPLTDRSARSGLCCRSRCEVAPRRTTRLENAHNTEFRELLYPWHPWSGLRIGIHEAIERLLGGAAAAWPLAVRAQQAAMALVGILSGQSPEAYEPFLVPFRQGLNETGFVEGTALDHCPVETGDPVRSSIRPRSN
jgi:hypothetical protein